MSSHEKETQHEINNESDDCDYHEILLLYIYDKNIYVNCGH